MSYLKNSLRLKITVFLLITALIFWLIPSGLIFGEGEEGGDGGIIVEEEEVIPPADTTAPVITPNGDNPATVEVGTEYSDAGAIAADDGVETPISGASNVDTTVAGSYTVIYNFSDAAGNAATEVTRTVNVVEPTGGTPPVETPLEEPVLNPVVFTNQADYGPGDIVIVTGSSWLPGETVKLSFLALPLNSVVEYYAVADSEGNISNNEFVIYDYHIDATIILTATGQTSNLTAQTVFTDAVGRIKIRKYVSGGLTGTFNFTLTKGSTTVNASITIASGSIYGEVIIPDLTTGSWTVTETPGSGFICTSPSSYYRSVLVYNGLTTNADFTNAPRTYSVTVNKSGLWEGWIDWSYVTDEAVFTLTGPEGPGSQVRTATLDNGWWGDPDHVTWSGLPAGSYTLDESYPVDNNHPYTSNIVFPQTFTLGPDKTFDVVNTIGSSTGTIVVQKVVKNFSGVVDPTDTTSFDVTVNGVTHSFSQAGSTSFTVPAGTYGATETGNANYDIIGNTGPVPVAAGGTAYITITNQQKEGHITIIKHGLQDAGNSNNDYSIFKLYKGSGQIGATVELDNLAGALRPDTYTWNGLDWGTYTIVEEDVDSNYYTYTVAYNPSDTVVIGAGNLSKTVNIYNNDPQIKTADITINKTVIGTPKVGNFEFIVADGSSSYSVYINGAGGTSAPITLEAGHTYTITEVDPGVDWDTTWTTTIPGATDVLSGNGITFSVTGSNVELIDGKSVSFENTRKTAWLTIIKDVNGPVLAGVDIFNFTATGMPPFALADGESVNITIESGIVYAANETLPNDNWLSDVADDGKIQIIDETAYSIEFRGTQNVDGDLQDSTITFTNTRKSGTVGVTKAIMDSLTLISYAPTYGTFSFGWSASDGTSDTFNLVSPGYLKILDVWCGIDYTIGETSTDPELEIVTDPITFTATAGDNGTWTFYNKTGSITVLKVDETDGKVLEGSTLRLFEADGTTPAIDAFGNPVGDKVTDADGKAYFTKLAFRTYIVEEISAPTGYSLAGSIDVPVDGDPGNDVSIVMKDPRIPGKVTIIKTDPAGVPLDGAGFTIYYKASGNPVMPERFTSSGMVTFDGLEWGSYVIVETTPPAGYDTSDPVEVTIDASNAESGVTVSRIDTLTPVAAAAAITVLGITAPGGGVEVLGIQELPFTGLNPLIPISGFSTIFAGGLMVVLSAIRKRFGKK